MCIRDRLKAFKKSHNLDDSYDPYKAAYGSMPTHAASNQAIQQMYINGHFCYAYKFGIITNGLGIVRDITFYNKDFLKKHPDIVVGKKSDSPDEDKSLADSKALLPVLIDFFQKHPLINSKTFLGDAAFDAINIYKSLFEEIGFQKAFIPLKTKLSVEGTDYTVNEMCIRDRYHSVRVKYQIPVSYSPPENRQKKAPPRRRFLIIYFCSLVNCFVKLKFIAPIPSLNPKQIVSAVSLSKILQMVS